MSRFRGEYEATWPDTAAAVKKAAGMRCVRCQHPDGDRRVSEAEWFTGEGDEHRRELQPCDARCTHPRDGKLRVLTVHHLDGHKSNDAWWNLLALCQVCHLQVQAKVIPEQAYLWPHTPWFIPYVCGFYAHHYGGLQISRADAEADPHRWLALGQPWLYAHSVSDPRVSPARLPGDHHG